MSRSKATQAQRIKDLNILCRSLDFHYIAIDGPIGAGKSALAERLAARFDASMVREDAENPFLTDFYAERPGSVHQGVLARAMMWAGRRRS